jgi:predicted RNase H-like HicB family nuclease
MSGMIEYPIIVFWSEEDESFIADVPDLGAFSAHGPTPEEALREVRRALASAISAAQERGLALPPPTLRPTLATAS